MVRFFSLSLQLNRAWLVMKLGWYCVNSDSKSNVNIYTFKWNTTNASHCSLTLERGPYYSWFVNQILAVRVKPTSCRTDPRTRVCDCAISNGFTSLIVATNKDHLSQRPNKGQLLLSPQFELSLFCTRLFALFRPRSIAPALSKYQILAPFFCLMPS